MIDSRTFQKGSFLLLWILLRLCLVLFRIWTHYRFVKTWDFQTKSQIFIQNSPHCWFASLECVLLSRNLLYECLRSWSQPRLRFKLSIKDLGRSFIINYIWLKTIPTSDSYLLVMTKSLAMFDFKKWYLAQNRPLCPCIRKYEIVPPQKNAICHQVGGIFKINSKLNIWLKVIQFFALQLRKVSTIIFYTFDLRCWRTSFPVGFILQLLHSANS